MPKQLLTAQDGSWHPKIPKTRPGHFSRSQTPQEGVLVPQNKPRHPQMGSGTPTQTWAPKDGF